MSDIAMGWLENMAGCILFVFMLDSVEARQTLATTSPVGNLWSHTHMYKCITIGYPEVGVTFL